MKERILIVRVNQEFIEKLDYLQRVNGFQSRSDAVRRIIEKEYRKEKEDGNTD